ncbi:dehydrodolichyl diphosphate synthase complex subunit nus1-like [Zingiber officinale]|uniref:dehydrodolichyl diphosphate synthase complex subunit nus1-like n=1 Tax=Zingiber officinale TaxID=94328 RepID=UPI001C4AB117|nr:dehydrodolichyl diphosphate synthase complex subunit nus1-like [Zingiber officinale]XP_042463564.1 dehydrodolichyl diphosphate synthase complex subunit nus1-like [Zingiber officinale]
MYLAHGITRALAPPVQKFQSSIILKWILGFCWYLLHLVVSLVDMVCFLNHLLLSSIISTGLLRKYQNLKLNNLNCLAIVVDSEEAEDITKTQKLLSWLSSIDVKCITLYDLQGVLKRTIGNDFKSMTNTSLRECKMSKMTVEILSLSDGKEGIAKAANFLISKYMKDDSLRCNGTKPTFSESQVSNALEAIGYKGPDPELLLVYGPARCHLGFPPWRLRYTEIIHMGSLRFMNYGSLARALYDFSKKNQNYGK